MATASPIPPEAVETPPQDSSATESVQEPVVEAPQKSVREAAKEDGISYNYLVVGWLAMLHLGALAAPFCFSWQGVVLALFLHWVSGSVGICLVYHRLLTHQSLKTFKPVQYFFALVGGLAGE